MAMDSKAHVAALQMVERLSNYVKLMAEEADVTKVDLVQAVAMMDVVFAFKETLQTLVKTPAEAVYDKLRFAVVPSLMEDRDITVIAIEGIGRVNVQDDIQVKVLNKEELHSWLTENDFEDMIVPNVNAQTLAAFLRGRMREGGELPKAVEIKPISRAKITRSK